MNLTEPPAAQIWVCLRTKGLPQVTQLQDFRPEDFHLGR